MNEVAKLLDLTMQDLMKMEKTLWEDVVAFAEGALSQGNRMHMNRRYFTISTAIYIEGIVIGVESAGNLTRVAKEESLTTKEAKAMYQNIVTQIPENRRDENKDKRSFADRVKNGLNSLSKLTDHKFELSTQNAEWRTFNNLIKIRDKIVHPKTHLDLIVSDSELYQVITSGTWFKDNLYFVCTGHR